MVPARAQSARASKIATRCIGALIIAMTEEKSEAWSRLEHGKVSMRPPNVHSAVSIDSFSRICHRGRFRRYRLRSGYPTPSQPTGLRTGRGGRSIRDRNLGCTRALQTRNVDKFGVPLKADSQVGPMTWGALFG